MTGHAGLVAFYELTQAKGAYCRALDTRDWNALAALMTSDIEFGMSDGDSDPQITIGRDQTLALFESSVARDVAKGSTATRWRGCVRTSSAPARKS